LTMVGPTCVSTRSKVSIELVGEFFGVRTQVDLGSTTVGRFVSADSAISANDAN
jgi:hypothetical protein